MSDGGKKAANAWKGWLASDNGKACVKYETLNSDNYLRNRLWHAFMAGYDSAIATNPRSRSQEQERET